VRIDLNRPRGTPRATLLLIHGMGGSSESSYMRFGALAALRRNWVAVRMNLRTSGGTEAQARTLYNAGQADDAGKVLEWFDDRPEFPRPHVVAGFSLGGNLMLRYAGLSGASSRADAFVAVNPPVDLIACVEDLERPRNRIYQAHYVRKLCAALQRFRRVRNWPREPPRAGRVRTVRRFDDLYTAPDAGFRSAEEYYGWASSAPHLAAIRRPTMILSAVNDPFVPVKMFEEHHGLPGIEFVHPSVGGHCGYWQNRRPRNWAAEQLVEFLGRSTGV